MSDINTLPPVARKIFYPCKKCAVERYQVVMAHTSSKVAKLECEVCGTKNNMKVGAPKAPRVKKDGTTSTKPRRATHKERWAQLTQKAGSDASPYNMKIQFKLESVINHPKFGLGVVTAATESSIQVVFEDEERALVHNRH